MHDVRLQPGRQFYFAVFSLSGFAGLIYESIWTQYVKLFLGHAAYAQTLVLCIFMGGMAIGSWIASRRAVQWRSLLKAYAAAEAVIGVAALVFHPVFVAATGLAYDHLLPALGSVALAQALKWSLAAGLLLPQSVLLGMTFPLMSGGVLRRFPQRPGDSLGMLYFTNSLGAALGVLASGFFLIGRIGLPGTILTAGLINILLALAVWLTSRDLPEPAPVKTTDNADFSASPWTNGLLAAAFVTGAASFIYEIAWIRGLSLVLGSSTHAFELMLSAFVLGLALGGLWIRRRIEHSADLRRLLGWIQVVMGLCALATLPLFNAAFSLMQYVLAAVARTEQAYQLFNVFSHALCLLLMLPATVCAGATLPLMTCMLLRRGVGERSIGAIYASNTVGAILGVVVAVHVLMPLMGLKGAIWVGALLDIGLGIALLAAIGAGLRRWELRGSIAVAALALLTAGLVKLDPLQLLSGVYRTGAGMLPKDTRVLFFEDGKTATVGLVRGNNGMMVISTNGKPDAGIMVEGNAFTSDELTMVLAGALGIAAHGDVRTVANIGIGSGLTTHVLLSTPQVERVDTVEIERFMVEAARGFGPRVQRAFTDPRSHIYIEDAKTFFSTRNARYDLIISEPSNPWVSGVASLFSDEFYARTVKHLQPNGVFVQWVQMYEADITLLASILKAMSPHFSDYAIYASNDTDVLLVAKKSGTLARLDQASLSKPGLSAELGRIHVSGAQDLDARRIGSRRTMEAMFQSIPAPINSDYFPFVDQNAPRMRFRNLNGQELARLTIHSLPLLEMLNGAQTADRLTPNTWLLRSRASADARHLKAVLLDRRYGDYPELTGAAALLPFLFADACVKNTSEDAWIDGVVILAGYLIPYLSAEELDPIWRRLENDKCPLGLSATQRKWLILVKAVARRDAAGMALASTRILERGEASGSPIRLRYAVLSGMLGNLMAGAPHQGLEMWNKYGTQFTSTGSPPLDVRLLLSLTAVDTNLKSAGAATLSQAWSPSSDSSAKH